MAIAWEKGFKRLTAVLSGIIAIIGVVLVCIGKGERGFLFIASILLTALPWGIFYLVRWITLGFLDTPQASSPAPEPVVTRAEAKVQPVPESERTAETAPSEGDAPPVKAKRRSLRETWWPTISSEQDALKCIRTAVGTALFIAATTGLLSVLALFGHPVLGMTGANLADAAIFLLLAYGTHKRSRIAATALVVLYVIGAIVSKRFTVIQMLFLLLLSNGMRGVFHLYRERPFAVIWPQVQWMKRALVIGGACIGVFAVIAAELFLEVKLDKPFVIKALYHTFSPRLTKELVAPTNDYSISLRGTKLTWREQPWWMASAMGSSAIWFLVGEPGATLTVFEEAGDLDKLEDIQLAGTLLANHQEKKDKTTGYLDIPRAVKGKFFMFESQPDGDAEPLKVIEGMFRASNKKLVIVRFGLYKPTDNTPVNIEDVVHDIELVANSFQLTAANK